MMIKYVKADPPSGNVFIREAPSKQSPSIGKPAYNYNQFGVIYESDEERTIDGVSWLHLRGWGWSMAKFFKEWEPVQAPTPDPEPEERNWIIGLNRDECLQLIDYLTGIVKGDD